MLHAPSLPGRSLFALLIGIDTYSSVRIAPTRGCVADADDIEVFLTRDLHISDDCIVNLRNEEATYANIVEELSKLAKNDHIAVNDSVLIYFSGHAVKRGMGVAFISHDAVPDSQPGEDHRFIWDWKFNGLLKRLAKAKGNNIVRPCIMFLLFPARHSQPLDCDP